MLKVLIVLLALGEATLYPWRTWTPLCWRLSELLMTSVLRTVLTFVLWLFKTCIFWDWIMLVFGICLTSGSFRTWRPSKTEVWTGVCWTELLIVEEGNMLMVGPLDVSTLWDTAGTLDSTVRLTKFPVPPTVWSNCAGGGDTDWTIWTVGTVLAPVGMNPLLVIGDGMLWVDVMTWGCRTTDGVCWISAGLKVYCSGTVEVATVAGMEDETSTAFTVSTVEVTWAGWLILVIAVFWTVCVPSRLTLSGSWMPLVAA